MRQYFQAEIASAGELGPLLEGMLEIQQKTLDRLDAAEFRIHSLDETVEELKGAFPGYDTEGHRRYHQTQIEMLEERRRLRVAIQEKTISGLLWAGLVFMGLASWNYLKHLVER